MSPLNDGDQLFFTAVVLHRRAADRDSKKLKSQTRQEKEGPTHQRVKSQRTVNPSRAGRCHLGRSDQERLSSLLSASSSLTGDEGWLFRNLPSQ